MQDWEKALNRFLDSWPDKEAIIGALVCGSFVTGNPTPHSDIDVHLVLRDETTWRERGNQIVDGFLIEYFANPPKQIVQYFKEDYEDHSQMAVIQFLTGRILFDDGTAQRLKVEAKEWYDKAFPRPSAVMQELHKYGLWDMLDNLQDACEEEAPHFWFVYHNMLNTLIQRYCNFVGYPAIRERRALDIFSNQTTRDKYLLPVFPDESFQDLATLALAEIDKGQALQLYEQLTDHVLDKMSGFEIDGWKLRTPVSY